MADSTPTTNLTLLRDFSDRLSPMVVKELRHGLRTRQFTGSLMVFHGLLIALMSSVLAGADEKLVTAQFWWVTIIAILGVLPARGFNALSAETQEGTLDMLKLTSISALRIVHGKWAALVGQSLLLIASLLPYLVARYHFGGVEIVREVTVLVLLVLASMVLTAAFVAFSTQRSLILRLFLAATVLVPAWALGFMMSRMVVAFEGDFIMRNFTRLVVWEQACLVVGWAGLAAYGIYFFLAFGASRIAPPSENHSTRKRLMALAMMGVLMLSGMALALWADPGDAMWCFVPAIILVLLVGMDLMTEETPRCPTALLPLAGGRGLLRVLGRWLLYPGWAAGLRLYLVLCGMVIAMLGVITIEDSGIKFFDIGWCIMLCIMQAAVVPLCLPARDRNRFALWWIVQWGLLAVGIMLTFVGNALDLKGFAVIGVLTPLTSLFAASGGSEFEDLLGVGAFIGSFWTIAALVFAAKEGKTIPALEDEAARLDEKPQAPEVAAA